MQKQQMIAYQVGRDELSNLHIVCFKTLRINYESQNYGGKFKKLK